MRWSQNPKEWEQQRKRQERKCEQLQKRQRRKYEERIEPLIAPHAARVRKGEGVPLGRVRDLYPCSQEDEAQGPQGENRLWLEALLAVTSRHDITISFGFTYPANDGITSQLPSPLQLLLVPKEPHELDASET